MKPIFDALVACGCVPNDDAGTLRARVHAAVDPTRRRVEIRLGPAARAVVAVAQAPARPSPSSSSVRGQGSAGRGLKG